MRKLIASLALITFALLAVAAPVSIDGNSGLVSKSAFARGGADDGAGHDAGDDHGGR